MNSALRVIGPSSRITSICNQIAGFAEYRNAFANVDLNLKHGGGKGWEQVFQLNSYHVPINDEAFGADGEEF
ncbi:unnamed protein product [Penicillium camemberti]|uniref:Str. FM013 n=1 Tax=Penicillium camemberti (strain FM 013) TaxID=1429867 RepID=A0A0G4PJF5_PENC3|nr:unnamed protein product [Penicillium camemberti]